MCGICGFINFDENKIVDVSLLKKMSAAILHRGPDDEGFYINKNVGLAVRRLSIIDLVTGNQPIHNENKKIWVVLNGEIYNFPEMKEELAARGHVFYTKTDTEVLVHLYEEYGTGLLNRINGMFAFAIWDDTEKKLFLARDRIGKKPLHYAIFNNTFIFGSELKALYVHPGVKKEIDALSLRKYLCLQYIPAPDTIFKGIKKLLPGYAMEYKNGSIRTFKYWDLNFGNKLKKNESEIQEELFHILENSVRRRLISDVPLGLFLSGGVDSSLVAGLMAGITSNINSFSITFEDETFNESKYARKIAEIFGFNHHEEILSPARMLSLIPKISNFLDEPMADPSIIPTYFLSEFTRKHVKVALSGDGGDELFAGYPTYQAHRLTHILTPLKFVIPFVNPFIDMIPITDKERSIRFRFDKFTQGFKYKDYIRNAIWRCAFTPDTIKKVLRVGNYWAPEGYPAKLGGGTVPVDIIFSDAEAYYKNCDADDLIEKMQYLDIKLYLQDEILVKVDRASMNCSLEVRCPILDKEVVEYAARIPSRMKLHNFTTKYIIKNMLKKRIPQEILNREKKGFTIPARRWFRSELKNYLLEVFDEQKINKEGIFNFKEIKKILTEHFEGTKDNRREIWTLLIFELWKEKYL